LKCSSSMIMDETSDDSDSGSSESLFGECQSSTTSSYLRILVALFQYPGTGAYYPVLILQSARLWDAEN
ncbi:MAG: hypothetical protein GY861_00090, partial [bacterium]|nr:hypothetical protein [bacterium]